MRLRKNGLASEDGEQQGVAQSDMWTCEQELGGRSTEPNPGHAAGTRIGVQLGCVYMYVLLFKTCLSSPLVQAGTLCLVHCCFSHKRLMSTCLFSR